MKERVSRQPSRPIPSLPPSFFFCRAAIGPRPNSTYRNGTRAPRFFFPAPADRWTPAAGRLQPPQIAQETCRAPVTAFLSKSRRFLLVLLLGSAYKTPSSPRSFAPKRSTQAPPGRPNRHLPTRRCYRVPTTISVRPVFLSTSFLYPSNDNFIAHPPDMLVFSHVPRIDVFVFNPKPCPWPQLRRAIPAITVHSVVSNLAHRNRLVIARQEV